MNRVHGAHVRVAVIGAGFAGIGAGMRLARQGVEDFLVLERADDVGGTWRDNTYPGVACDIPAHLYSFSFAPNPEWRSRYPSGQQIQDYLRSCAAEAGVTSRIRTGTALRQAQWDERARLWRIDTTQGMVTAQVLVLATGRFTEPHLPAIPGLEEFGGPVIHTARWDPGFDPAGMRIGVVGTGASAAQLIPQLAARGAQLTVFQRSASWVVPKEDRDYTTAERELFAEDDDARAEHRQRIFAESDAGFAARLRGSVEHAELRRRAQEHLGSQVPDPALRQLLTPDYEAGCKRVLLSDDFYPAMTSDAVTLEPSALAWAAPGQAAAAAGTVHELDALVFATGFEATSPAVARLVHGGSGTLAEHWAEGMTSYASTAVPGFPNLMLLGGPNAALGHNSAIAMLETQIQHLLSMLQALPAGGAAEPTAEAEAEYTAMIDERAERTVWTTAGCTSWFRDPRSGRITLLWPGTAAEYAQRFSAFDPARFSIRPPGPDEHSGPEPLSWEAFPAEFDLNQDDVTCGKHKVSNV